MKKQIVKRPKGRPAMHTSAQVMYNTKLDEQTKQDLMYLGEMLGLTQRELIVMLLDSKLCSDDVLTLKFKKYKEFKSMLGSI
jgi:hypothetical protein